MPVVISDSVLAKLNTKHNISEKEVIECLINRKRQSLIDPRQEHRTEPVSKFLVSETNHRRVLKIVYVLRDRNIHIKTAFEPSVAKVKEYERNAKLLSDLRGGQDD